MKNIRLVILSLFSLIAFYKTTAQKITINQLGFGPGSSKQAVVSASSQNKFYITSTNGQEIYFEGPLTSPGYWEPSQENVQVADFTDFNQEGTYLLKIPGVASTEVEIRKEPYLDLTKGALKALYYNRASTSLEEEYAGTFARASGHPDNQVYIHSSAASEGRPTGTVVSAPKGWYDAGDFNKYIVNSGISTYTVLALYEQFPEYFENIQTNIPESSNNIPDILDEALWNLEWMLDMQDPTDGGVYHKLTSKNFTGNIMPAQDNTTRYMVGKSSTATLDFAAVMAQASRIFKNVPGKSDLANRMIDAAEYAYEWAKDNPGSLFDNPSDISTGEYGDWRDADEFYWAAAELYITTGNDYYYTDQNLSNPNVEIPGWQTVEILGVISLVNHKDDLTPLANIIAIQDSLINEASWLRDNYKQSAYRTSMGTESWMFNWGSNSGALNQSLIMLNAYLASDDVSFLKAAQANFDYVLGRNPTEYSFVTGYGNKTPRHIHHRVSEADGISDPLPGFLVGGVNPSQQDGCAYPSNLPGLSYLDSECSYATNEIAINWNAPLIYIAGAFTALDASFETEETRNNYFTSHPQSITLCNNEGSTTLSAGVSNSNTGDLSWQVSVDNGANYVDLINNQNYSGVTTSSLLISNISTALSGNQYRLVIRNNEPLYSLPARLTAYSQPNIISENACGAGNAVVKTDIDIENFAWFSSNTGGNILFRGDSVSPEITGQLTLYGGIEASNAQTLIDSEDNWFYTKGDVNPGQNWYQNNFDDSRWKNYQELPLQVGGTLKGENYSVGKTAVASSTANGNISNITDGSESTSWTSENSEEEWVYVDLGESREFNRVDVNFGSSRPNDVIIQTSDNGFAWTTISENGFPSSGPNSYYFTATSSRYVRVLLRSNSSRRSVINQVEVYEPLENPFLGTIANNYSTVYLRKDFEIGNPSDLQFLSMNLGYQDGILIYINGKEILQRNTPASLSNNSTATQKLNEERYERFITNEPDTILKQGTNTIAVQLLNDALSDRSIFFSMALSTEVLSYGSECPRAPVTIGIDTCQAFPNANRYAACENDANFVFFTKESEIDGDYLWDFGAGATPETAEGIGPHQVSYSSAGEKEISLTIDGNDPVTNTNNIKVLTAEECFLSAPDEIDLPEASISVYPNPFSTGVYFKLSNSFFKEGELTITDVNGRVIKQTKLYHNSPIYLGEDLQRGIYFGKLKTAQKDFAFKLIKE